MAVGPSHIKTGKIYGKNKEATSFSSTEFCSTLRYTKKVKKAGAAIYYSVVCNSFSQITNQVKRPHSATSSPKNKEFLGEGI